MLGNGDDRTREDWLNRFAIEARPVFEASGFPLPNNIRISVGFPSTGTRGKRIGECWGEAASSDGHFEIFLRPSLESSSRIADVLTHELVHAAVGLKAGHGIKFKRCATALGLTGKMTATVAGPGWYEWASPILDRIGDMPYAAMREMQSSRKKQTTRMIKCECDTCGMVFRTSAKWISDGLVCPVPECGGAMDIEGE